MSPQHIGTAGPERACCYRPILRKTDANTSEEYGQRKVVSWANSWGSRETKLCRCINTFTHTCWRFHWPQSSHFHPLIPSLTGVAGFGRSRAQLFDRSSFRPRSSGRLSTVSKPANTAHTLRETKWAQHTGRQTEERTTWCRRERQKVDVWFERQTRRQRLQTRQLSRSTASQLQR